MHLTPSPWKISECAHDVYRNFDLAHKTFAIACVKKQKVTDFIVTLIFIHHYLILTIKG